MPGRTVVNCTWIVPSAVEFEPGRRAIHVHFEIVDDDLVVPDIAEQIGVELVFETARRGDLPAIALSGDQLEILLVDGELVFLRRRGSAPARPCWRA